MNIDHLVSNDDNNVIVTFVLENGEKNNIYWNDLKKYMIINGHFKEKYLTSRNDEDVLEFHQYWEEIDISYQENFIIIGLYLNERKNGTIVIWDVVEEKYSYIFNGNNTYGILILKSLDLIFMLTHVSRNITKVTVNILSKKGMDPVDLATTFKAIKFFEPEDYKVSAAGLIVSAESNLIKEYGELGLFFSSEKDELYCHVEGKLYTYKMDYILEQIKNESDLS